MKKETSVNIQRVVFDFDNTLFDTETLKECFWKIGYIHGFSQEEITDLYKKAREDSGHITITLESFLKVVKEQLKKQKKEFLDRQVYETIDEMENASSLLPGAKKVLEFCKRMEMPRYLLSLGVEDWQKKKIKISRVDRFFPKENIIFTDDTNAGKEETLLKMFGEDFDGDGTILLNDKPDETEQLLIRFPRLLAFLRWEKRDKRYNELDFQKLVFSFPGRVGYSDDLSDSLEILKKIGVFSAKTSQISTSSTT